jgi:hypothetical protein
MPLKVLFYKASDFLSNSIFKQALLGTNKDLYKDSSNIEVQNAPLYNQDGTIAGKVVWNYFVYKNIDNSFYNETGFRTLILEDGTIVSTYNEKENKSKSGLKFIDKATSTTGIYNSINDVYIQLLIFDDLRQLTIYYE